MARPVVWNEEKKQNAIELILDDIYSGRSCRKILDKADREVYPSFVTFCEWLDNDPLLVKHYTRACEARADKIFDDMLSIADDNARDTFIDDNGIERTNNDVIQRSKLMVDTRKWMLGKLAPKKYGDKLDLTTDGEKIQNQVTIFQLPDNGRG